MRRFFQSLLLSLLSAALLLGGCAKEKLKIGREDPEAEIQKCIALSKKKHYEEAVDCLEIFKSRFPGTAQGQEAGLKIADTYFAQHQYLLAADSYLAFVDLNPLHPKTDYALYRAALAYLNEAPKPIDRDQQYLFKAKETMQRALRASYRSTYEDLMIQTLKVIDERLAQRIFYIGRFYWRTGEYRSAIPRFEDLLEKYPQAEIVPQALYYLIRCQLGLKQSEQAQAALQKMVENFPKNDWTIKAQKHYSAREQ